MRQLASVIGSLALLLAAAVALAPVAVHVPHGDDRCGPPLVRVPAQEDADDPNAQAVIDRCEEAAAGRLVVAGVITGVGIVAFVALGLAAHRHEVVERRRRRARRLQQEEEAARAAADAARVAQAAARDAALRG